MSDAPKLLTPEEVEGGQHCHSSEEPCYSCRADATIIALAERLASMPCPTCFGQGGDEYGEDCPDCDGSGEAHKDWQAALRSPGEG